MSTKTFGHAQQILAINEVGLSESVKKEKIVMKIFF